MSYEEPGDQVTLVNNYVELIEAWDRASKTPSKANRLVDEAHRVASRLRESEGGRQALLALIDHENQAVKLWVAAECTVFAPKPATKALRKLAKSDGHHAFSAEMTLKEFKAGRLRMDW